MVSRKKPPKKPPSPPLGEDDGNWRKDTDNFRYELPAENKLPARPRKIEEGAWKQLKLKEWELRLESTAPLCVLRAGHKTHHLSTKDLDEEADIKQEITQFLHYRQEASKKQEPHFRLTLVVSHDAMDALFPAVDGMRPTPELLKHLKACGITPEIISLCTPEKGSGYMAGWRSGEALKSLNKAFAEQQAGTAKAAESMIEGVPDTSLTPAKGILFERGITLRPEKKPRY